MELERLTSLRMNQSKLKVGKYNSLRQYNNDRQNQGANIGNKVVLPSSYVGSRRYMDQLYFDGMTICSHVWFPDLFITFTCKIQNWPEIQRLRNPTNLKAHDRPNIISSV